jgi:hypothetical protein
MSYEDHDPTAFIIIIVLVMAMILPTALLIAFYTSASLAPVSL